MREGAFSKLGSRPWRHVHVRTCCWKPIAGQYVLLRCWVYGWCLWDTPGICQCVFRIWSCTVWSQYDSGSAASAAPSGLAWRGRERPADERDVLQRSGRATVARVLTAGRRLVLRYSSLASTWQVQAPAVSWLLLRCEGVSGADDAGGIAHRWHFGDMCLHW